MRSDFHRRLLACEDQLRRPGASGASGSIIAPGPARGSGAGEPEPPTPKSSSCDMVVMQAGESLSEAAARRFGGKDQGSAVVAPPLPEAGRASPPATPALPPRIDTGEPEDEASWPVRPAAPEPAAEGLRVRSWPTEDASSGTASVPAPLRSPRAAAGPLSQPQCRRVDLATQELPCSPGRVAAASPGPSSARGQPPPIVAAREAAAGMSPPSAASVCVQAAVPMASASTTAASSSCLATASTCTSPLSPVPTVAAIAAHPTVVTAVPTASAYLPHRLQMGGPLVAPPPTQSAKGPIISATPSQAGRSPTPLTSGLRNQAGAGTPVASAVAWAVHGTAGLQPVPGYKVPTKGSVSLSCRSVSPLVRSPRVTTDESSTLTSGFADESSQSSLAESPLPMRTAL
mmetsp:Transcript_105415/g.335571  ORF Transcript_105415/g.335571 Transcript_105415/m.335571 type:complete len:402 (+) Transcript_105415:1-1206(+)